MWGGHFANKNIDLNMEITQLKQRIEELKDYLKKSHQRNEGLAYENADIYKALRSCREAFKEFKQYAKEHDNENECKMHCRDVGVYVDKALSKIKDILEK